jgi:hypothetical protein
MIAQKYRKYTETRAGGKTKIKILITNTAAY